MGWEGLEGEVSQYLSTDPKDGKPIAGYLSMNPTAGDPNVSSTVAGRAGEQVLRPINARSVIEAAIDAGRMGQALPGAMASVYGDYAAGALKGLGQMAAPAVKAAGLGNDYTDAALSPENDVQSAGAMGAQIGATGLATAATGVIGKGLGLGAKVARGALSPVGSGVIAGTSALASGHGLPGAIGEGVLVGSGMKALGGLPGILTKLRGVAPKAGAAVTAAAKAEAAAIKAQAISDAEALLETKQLRNVEDQILRRELAQAKKLAGMEAKAIKPIPPSKLTPAVKPAPKAPEPAPKPAPKPPESPSVDAAAKAERQKQHIAESIARKAEKDAKNVASEGDLADNLALGVELGKKYPRKPGESSFEWLKRVNSEMKAKASEAVHSPPAFKGQQSAKGATKARFAMIEERLRKAKEGKK